MDDRTSRARSNSSASSLFFPTPKIPPQKGNFLMTYFSCPVGSVEQASSTHSAVRPRGTATITENTYKMEPDICFSVAEVRAIILQHLQSLESQKYDAKLCRELAKAMSNSIMSDLKMLECTRFKFVCTVTIGQNKGQGIRIASRSVWNTDSDRFVSESFRNESLFAVGVVFGVYKE
ncbi:dynein light chain Tctex-type 5-B-like [Montipora capricornis]|uniref:dynein light chain Tctex-type 5-B-like n=1 Tax=Montipora capricornis TaxID=246305 RepID=UPI0035F113D9